YAAQDLTPWMVADPNGAPPALTAFGDLETFYAPRPIASVRTPDSKLIRELRWPGNEELYDLKIDPGEHNNRLAGALAADTPLRQDLTTWRSGWESLHPLSQKVELSEEHKERLRALGYLR